MLHDQKIGRYQKQVRQQPGSGRGKAGCHITEHGNKEEANESSGDHFSDTGKNSQAGVAEPLYSEADHVHKSEQNHIVKERRHISRRIIDGWIRYLQEFIELL